MSAIGSPTAGLPRLLRAVAVAGTAVGLAVSAHAAADGCVGVSGSLIALLVSLPSSAVITRREASLATLLGWLLLAQVGAHLILAATCGGTLVADQQPVMLVLHLLAVLIGALLLRAGEALLWTTNRLRRAWGVALLHWRPAFPAFREPPLAAMSPEPAARSIWHTPSRALRGPPQAHAS